MTTNTIQIALTQIREIRQRVIDGHRFKGYSGRARITSGCLAFGAAIVLGSQYIPQTSRAHLLGWGFVAGISFLLNYGALTYWFLYDPEINRDFRKLKPAVDVLPPLFVAGILSLILIQNGLHSYLFGTWMCFYGLANLATRAVLPKPIGLIGVYYIVCGTICLTLPTSPVVSPWHLGLIFFVGEVIGGIILQLDRTRQVD